MDDDGRRLVERLFEAFNRRDAAAMEAVCAERMEFFPIAAEGTDHAEPYVGPSGLREFLADVSRAWEELLITSQEVRGDRGRLLVKGRIYLRSRELGIRDMPAAWIWEVADGRLVRGEVFADPAEAARRFASEPPVAR